MSDNKPNTVTKHTVNFKSIRNYICGLICHNEYLDGSNISMLNISGFKDTDGHYYSTINITVKLQHVSFHIRKEDGLISLHYNNTKLITSIKTSVIKSYIRLHLKGLFYDENTDLNKQDLHNGKNI